MMKLQIYEETVRNLLRSGANMETIFLYTKDYFGLSCCLSFQMPEGYENAFGLYDPLIQTLFLNQNLPITSSIHPLYYFLHELRHAIQYSCPELFSQEIRISLPYVVQYDGACFKMGNGRWLSTHLDGEQSWFTELYLSLPYELDANQFALTILSNTTAAQLYPSQLEQLRNLWLPKCRYFSPAETWGILSQTFETIDRQIKV